MLNFSVGKNPVPYIACSRTSTGGRTGANSSSTRRERASRKIACSTRAASPTMYPKREPESLAARSISKRPSSRWSRALSSRGGSPQRRSSTASCSVSPSGTESCGGFGTCSSAASRSPSAAASCSSACRSSSLTCFNSSTCSGVGLPCSFWRERSSSTLGTSSRQRSSAASHASNAFAAPLRASAARYRSGSLRAAFGSIKRLRGLPLLRQEGDQVGELLLRQRLVRGGHHVLIARFGVRARIDDRLLHELTQRPAAGLLRVCRQLVQVRPDLGGRSGRLVRVAAGEAVSGEGLIPRAGLAFRQCRQRARLLLDGAGDAVRGGGHRPLVAAGSGDERGGDQKDGGGGSPWRGGYCGAFNREPPP